jgi:anti-sigma regulatory factor (Ser/Thr protein kinase)
VTAPTAPGYVHEVGFYGSDEEFADLILPFAQGGIDNDEPMVFAYDPATTALLRQWLPDTAPVSYITDTGHYATPAKALRAWRSLVESKLAAGAQRVRIAGNVPHPGYGMSFAGWDRYEAAVDRALGDLPVWAPCLYDTRIAPTDVIERAASLHHTRRHLDGASRRNDRYAPPRGLADFLRADPDPIEQRAPLLQLTDPTPAAARAAITALLAGRVVAQQCEAILVATSEAVTNAILHGAPPVSVRGWLADGRVVICVHDRGAGPADPLAGLVPRGEQGAESGRGLWIAHQLDIDVALIPGADGFTVRLRTQTGAAPAAG